VDDRAVTTVYHGDDIAFDLYPAADPKNGARIRRLVSLEKNSFVRREQKGTGIGAIIVPGGSDDAEAIDPALGQYVKAERRGPAVGLTLSAAADNILDTAAPHGLIVGNKLEIVTLAGGSGLSTSPAYYVASVPSSSSLTVAATKGGTAIDFTTDITAGSIRKLTTVAGFFLLNGQYQALTQDGRRPLLLTGPGPLAYLARAVMPPHSYVSNDPQPEGMWPLHLQGGGFGSSALGSMWARALTEMTRTQADDAGPNPYSPHPNANDRLVNPLPALTFNFNGFVDSNGAAWEPWDGEFSVQTVHEDGLRIAFRFMQAGLELEMDADTFELRAFNPGTLGTDRTGSAWAPDVVRFQAPTDNTVGTGNILTAAQRALTVAIRRSLVWAGYGDTWGVARDNTQPIRWEGGYNSDAGDEASLNVVAAVQLAERTDAGDVPRIPIKSGNDPLAGEYTAGPGGHFDLWDTALLHSGTGTWDWNEHAAVVSAIEWRLRDDDNGEWKTFAEFGSNFRSLDQVMAFAGGGGGGPHTHPPNPGLCVAGVPAGATTIGGPLEWPGGAVETVSSYPTGAPAIWPVGGNADSQAGWDGASGCVEDGGAFAGDTSSPALIAFAGVPYRWRARMRSDSPANSLRVRFFNVASVQLADNVLATGSINVWAEYVETFTAPAGTAYMRFMPVTGGLSGPPETGIRT
jgi:hypothetical protein